MKRIIRSTATDQGQRQSRAANRIKAGPVCDLGEAREAEAKAGGGQAPSGSMPAAMQGQVAVPASPMTVMMSESARRKALGPAVPRPSKQGAPPSVTRSRSSKRQQRQDPTNHAKYTTTECGVGHDERVADDLEEVEVEAKRQCADPPSAAACSEQNGATCKQGVASRSAFSAVLEAEGENDVRGALFQFLQLLDIVRLSSLSRKWRALSLQRDIRSVCASLPAHLDSPDVNNVTLQRFLCKLGGFTTFLQRCENLRTVLVSMSDFYLHPCADRSLGRMFEALSRMDRLRVLSLMNYSHNHDCEERFFDAFFAFLLSVRRGARHFAQLEHLSLRMGNNPAIRHVHRLFAAADRRAFAALRGLTLDYQCTGPIFLLGLEALPSERDVLGCLHSLPKLESLKLHGPGVGNFFQALDSAACRSSLRHVDVQCEGLHAQAYTHLAQALQEADLPSLRTLSIDPPGLWAILPALRDGKCTKLISLRVLIHHVDARRVMPCPDLTAADQTTPASLHDLLERLAELLHMSRALPDLTHLRLTLGRRQGWGLIKDREGLDTVQRAITRGRRTNLTLEWHEAFAPPQSRAPEGQADALGDVQPHVPMVV